jgi:hypothetical protein
MDALELETMRAAAAIEVERTSIRAVALAMRMSHGALFNLVSGKTRRVYGKTATKLREWYLRKAIESGNLTADAARNLIDQLVWGVPPQHRIDARNLVVRSLVTLREHFGVTPPNWLTELSKAQGD